MILFIFAVGLLATLLPEHVFAMETTIAPSAVGITDLASMYSLIQISAQWLVVFGIMIGAVMVIVGGLQYIVAGGEDEGTAAAKGRIYTALIGIALLLLAYSLINLVGSFLSSGPLVS